MVSKVLEGRQTPQLYGKIVKVKWVIWWGINEVWCGMKKVWKVGWFVSCLSGSEEEEGGREVALRLSGDD